MSAIGPGDWVECVDNGATERCRHCGCAHNPRPELAIGMVYRVAGIRTESDGEVCFYLDRVRHKNGGSFVFWRFRPVYRPKADLIEQLKKPAPDVVRETVFAE